MVFIMRMYVVFAITFLRNNMMVLTWSVIPSLCATLCKVAVGTPLGP